MDVEVFRTLMLVDEHRNYRIAAERVNLSQSAVAKRMHSLEIVLGEPLVERRGRHMVLTPRGQTVLPNAKRLVRVHDEMVEQLTHAGDMAGTLRLGVVDTILFTWLPEFLERHRERYPSVEFELSSAPTLELADALQHGRIDMAIMLGPSADRPLTDVALGEMEIGFYKRRGLVLEGERPGSPLSPFAVSRLKIITFPRGAKPYVDLAAAMNRLDLPRLPRLNSCTSVLTMRDIAERGIAVASLPVLLAHGAELERIDLGIELPNLCFSASYDGSAAGGGARRSCGLAAEVAAYTRMGGSRTVPECRLVSNGPR